MQNRKQQVIVALANMISDLRNNIAGLDESNEKAIKEQLLADLELIRKQASQPSYDAKMFATPEKQALMKKVDERLEKLREKLEEKIDLKQTDEINNEISFVEAVIQPFARAARNKSHLIQLTELFLEKFSSNAPERRQADKWLQEIVGKRPSIKINKPPQL